MEILIRLLLKHFLSRLNQQSVGVIGTKDKKTYDAFFELGYHRVLRTYPNGQRAPLIEWDEVLLPEGAIA